MKKVGVFVLGFVFMLALSGFVVAAGCEITEIYASQVPGYAYYELFIEARGALAGEEFGIVGAESWDSLKLTVESGSVESPTEIVLLLKSTQTLNEVAKNYILDRKENIDLTYNGEIVCTQSNLTENFDVTAPVILGASPYGTIYSNNVQLSLDTDEIATCAYSKEDTSYDNMIPLFNTDSTQHWQEITAINGVHEFYFRCRDLSGNTNVESFYISFEIVESITPNTMSVDINKGWNLVYGFVDPSQIIDSNINENNIKAIYALMPNIQEYARAWPDPEWDKLGTLDDDYLLNTGMWVYSDVGGYMTYSLYTDVMPFNKRQIYAGWNFVGITDDMTDSRLSDLSGDCNIVSSYTFDGWSQEWAILPLYEKLYDWYIGRTWVIKVREDCYLSKAPAVFPAPPVLPAGENITETDEPLEIGEYVLTSTESGEDCDYVEIGNVSGEICMTISNLRYENPFDDERVYITLIDYSQGFDIFKSYIEEYVYEVNSQYEYAYNLYDDNAILWFSDGKYELVVSERGYGSDSNEVTDYFYDKYPAYDAGIEVKKCIDSDGGVDYFRQGIVYQSFTPSGPKEDECIDSSTLTEWSCVGQETFMQEDYVCPNGCEWGRCLPDGECNLEGVTEKGCYFDNVYYNVKKLDGCGVTPVSFEISYENTTESFEVDQGMQYLLSNNVTFNLWGAPCGYDVINIQFGEEWY